ncbi:recombinase family protein [Agromyces aerolatus]|uniref:dehydrogenase n=1 Tax=Agromyces sp. LY-1074 TaxID=3074080 RepID=UPI002858B237|nr:MULTISPECIES: dehydrogenase [unclassified Agromyces]MDR5699599.1 dehydrogenase [Agromyces sp. LY-1074]MDR5705895.1 dehydrogenase [Agromyces sp. LY-1358]
MTDTTDHGTSAVPATTVPATTASLPVVHDHTHAAIGCPECFEELQLHRDWWKARPEGSRLVGIVVARDDMPSVVEQRNDLARFGVAILDFKHPAPEVELTWEQRLGRLFDSLQAGDVLVVANERALGRKSDEIARTIRVLRQHNLVVKVLNHGAKHLEDAHA